MINVDEMKITPRDEPALKLLVQGCSNKGIASQLNISPRTGETALTHAFPAGWYPRRPEAGKAGHGNFL